MDIIDSRVNPMALQTRPTHLTPHTTKLHWYHNCGKLERMWTHQLQVHCQRLLSTWEHDQQDVECCWQDLLTTAHTHSNVMHCTASIHDMTTGSAVSTRKHGKSHWPLSTRIPKAAKTKLAVLLKIIDTGQSFPEYVIDTGQSFPEYVHKIRP